MGDIFSNQSIQNFYQAAYKKDFARKNLFRVLAIETGDSNIKFDDTDLVYVTSTSLPQYAINNQALPFMGMKFNIPGTANYPSSDNWKIKFRMPADLSLRAKIEAWTRSIFNDATSTGGYELKSLGTLWLALMGKNGIPIRTYKVIGIYCKELGDFSLDITSGGDVVEQDLTLAYQYWE